MHWARENSVFSIQTNEKEKPQTFKYTLNNLITALVPWRFHEFKVVSMHDVWPDLTSVSEAT